MAYEVLTKKIDLVDSIIYYQIDCIDKHPELPILPIRVAMHPHHVCLEIDISDKISLGDFLADHAFTRSDWIGLFLSIGEIILRGIELFLDPFNFTISRSTVFFLSNQESLRVGDCFYLYIPVFGDSKDDPVHHFMEEILQFSSMDSSISVKNNSIGQEAPDFIVPGPASRILPEGLFSREEEEQIATWSLDNLKDGITRLRSMLDPQDSSNRSDHQKAAQKPRLAKQARNRLVQSDFLSKASTFPFIIGVVAIETALIFTAFRILQHQSGFSNRLTPVLLVSSILICFGLLDLFLLFSKKSALFLMKNKDSNPFSQLEGRDAESIFRCKEEKTVLIEHSADLNRIAMICSGVPGTPEESAGLKAYILTDDFLVGRDGSKVDFKVNCLSVGRVHARIQRRENSFFIEDLESRNGTYLNQKKLKKKEEYRLPENCKIRFADREFYFVAN